MIKFGDLLPYGKPVCWHGYVREAAKAVIVSDVCELEELVAKFDEDGETRGLLRLGAEWTRRWSTTWKVDGGEVTLPVRDMANVPVLSTRPARSGKTPGDCARRKLKEEAEVEATLWQHLGTYAIPLGNNVRLSLFLAENLQLGTQGLNDTEEDFKLS